MKKPLLLLLTAVAVFSAHAETDAKLSVYFIGNSLTASTTLDRVHQLFSQRGIDLQFGSQLSAGKSLLRHMKYAEEPKQKWKCWETGTPSGSTFVPVDNFYVQDEGTYRFGRYDQALAKHKWDIVVMQPFLSPLGDDLEATTAFIDLALKNKSSDRFYIYQTWPRRPRVKGAKGDAPNDGVAEDIDYPALWAAPYEFSPEQRDNKAATGSASRDFSAKLLAALNEKYPSLPQPIRLIPAGEVLFALDAKIKANSLPGLQELAARDPEKLPGLRPGTGFEKGANILYADPVHFNPMPHKSGVLGNLVSGTTLFTVLSGQNPVGLSVEAYGFTAEDADLVKAVQQTIWDVVSSNPATGVKP